MPISAGHFVMLLVVLVVVLIIWGPSKLPDIGSGLGRGIREFRKASTEAKDSFSKAVTDEPAAPAATAAPAVLPAPAAAAEEPKPEGQTVN